MAKSAGLYRKEKKDDDQARLTNVRGLSCDVICSMAGSHTTNKIL